MGDYTVGRPPKYKTAEEVQKKITEYFEKGMRMKSVVIGPPNNRSVEKIPVPTITGLALFLGFESRQSFYAYEKKSEFSYTIKKARTFIEREYEELLSTGNVTGAIFALKNMGWKDTQTIEANIDGPKRIGIQKNDSNDPSEDNE